MGYLGVLFDVVVLVLLEIGSGKNFGELYENANLVGIPTRKYYEIGTRNFRTNLGSNRPNAPDSPLQ